MKIVFTRLNKHRHQLTIRREDSSEESVELETRSLLLHDLVHLAVETEADLQRGFWGLVASGVSLSDLRRDEEDESAAELWTAEKLVGPMQSLWNGRMDPEQYMARARGVTAAVDATFVERVSAQLRALTGHWRATGFGQSMTVDWPLG